MEESHVSSSCSVEDCGRIADPAKKPVVTPSRDERTLPLFARYESLVRLSQALRVDRGADELCRFIVTELRGIVKCDVIGITRYDEAADQLTWLRLEIKNRRVIPTPCAWQGTVSQWVYDSQEPFVVYALSCEERFLQSAERLQSQGLESICILPLTAPQGKIGTIYFGNDHAGTYSDEELQFLSLVAATVAVALGNAFRFVELQTVQADLQRERERLRQLLDLTNSLVSNRDLSDLLRIVASSLRELLQCDIGQVILPEPCGSHSLRIKAASPGGCPPDMQLSGSICERVFRTGEVQSGNVRDVEILGMHHALDRGSQRVKTICVFPLARQNRNLGVLALGRFEEKLFTQGDLALLGQVARQVAIAVDNALAYHHITKVRDKLVQEKAYLEDEIHGEILSREIIGESDSLRRVLEDAARVAATDSTVLICGETGTGKELIARMIHERSPRDSHAFVKLNCAAIPTGLLESELFGHEKGAFTGAVTQRIGRFELANNGTLFLDEIGETPLELQPKLLHVLQEQEFERLGGSRTIHTNVRLVAATNRDLAEMVGQKVFRSDLFYRLNVFPIRVPPLRDRVQDIPLLAWYFVRKFASRMKRNIETIPPETMDRLCNYRWPGNIRELQNVIERAVILSTGPALELFLSDTSAEQRNEPGAAFGTLKEAERKHILAVLEDTKWVLGGPNGAAARLGMKRPTLQFHMHKLGISRATHA